MGDKHSIERQLRDIHAGRVAARLLPEVNRRRQPGAILAIPPAIHVNAPDGSAGYTPIRVWRTRDTDRAALEPGTVVPATFRAELTWETVNQTVGRWPVLGGTFTLASTRTSGRLSPATAWRATNSGTVPADIPVELESRTIEPLPATELPKAMQRLTHRGATAHQQLAEDATGLLYTIAARAFVAQPHAHDREDLIQESQTVLAAVALTFTSPDRPAASFTDVLALRIKTHLARLKPAGMHEDTARYAAAAANTDERLSPEQLANDLAELTANTSRRARTTGPTDRQIASAARGQLAAANGHLSPASLDQPVAAFYETDGPSTLGDTVAAQPDDTAIEVSLDYWLDLARDMLAGAEFDDYHAFACGLLALAIHHDAQGASGWDPKLFTSPVMAGFVNAFDPFATNRRWTSARNCNTIRREVADELGFFVRCPRPAERVEAAWQDRLTHRSYAGRPTFTAEARRDCIAAAITMFADIFPLITRQLQTHLEAPTQARRSAHSNA